MTTRPGVAGHAPVTPVTRPAGGRARAAAPHRHGAHAAARVPAEPGWARPRRPQAAGARRFAADGAAAAVVAAVVPLCFLQAPNAIAWAMASLGPVAAGPQGPAAVLRAAGLALPAMAAAAGVGALAATRLRPWPVLLAGLLLMAVADALGGSARTVSLIGLDRMLHGVAAGIALPAAVALAWERAPGARRVLAALWSAVAVTGLVVAPAVIRDRLASGDWHAALAPYPWLTGTALALAALYAVLADGPGTLRRPSREGGRQDATHERAQLAVLAVPAIGLSALGIAVSYREPATLLAAASVGIVIVIGVAAVASADHLVGGPLCFPLIGAVIGLVVAPAAGAVTSLRALAPGHLSGASWLPLAATAGSAAAAAAIALMLRDRPQAVVLAGLAVAAESLAAAHVAGPFVAGPVLAGISALLAGGLTAAMTAALADATAATALSGVSLMLAGLMTGYLAAGAVQVRMVIRPATAPLAARDALSGAAGVWDLAGASCVIIVFAVIILAGWACRAGAAARWHR